MFSNMYNFIDVFASPQQKICLSTLHNLGGPIGMMQSMLPPQTSGPPVPVRTSLYDVLDELFPVGRGHQQFAMLSGDDNESLCGMTITIDELKEKYLYKFSICHDLMNRVYPPNPSLYGISTFVIAEQSLYMGYDNTDDQYFQLAEFNASTGYYLPIEPGHMFMFQSQDPNHGYYWKTADFAPYDFYAFAPSENGGFTFDWSYVDAHVDDSQSSYTISDNSVLYLCKYLGNVYLFNKYGQYCSFNFPNMNYFGIHFNFFEGHSTNIYYKAYCNFNYIFYDSWSLDASDIEMFKNVKLLE